MQVDEQINLDAIIRAGEHIFNRVKEQDMISLEQKLPEYADQIEQYFLKLDKHELSTVNIESLEQLIDTHKNLVTLISEEKEKLLISIKHLQTGKKMQNTYSKTTL
ncbi:MAG: hypothetical protein DHS20C09_02400 [marine bacterium B5-7]|nr:MAG: hypothetical protein DHS20C09_02400 [marine bacterium B5-7]